MLTQDATCFTVKGLFGKYNHTLDIPKSGDFKILFGYNGSGKTSIMRIIESFFSHDYSYILKIPFKEANLLVKVSDNTYYNLKLTFNSEEYFIGEKIFDYKLSRIDSEGKEEIIIRSIYDNFKKSEEYRSASRAYDRSIRGYDMIHDDDEFSGLDILKVFKSFYISENENKNTTNIKITNPSESYFIDTYRLRNNPHELLPDTPLYMRRWTRHIRDKEKVTKISEDIAGKIKEALAKYSKISEELDRSYIFRAIESPLTSTTYKKEYGDTIRNDYTEQLEFQQKVSKLVSEVELISEEYAIPENKIMNSRWTATFVKLYVEDSKKKFEPFVSLLNRIEKCIEIVNTRLVDKEIFISDQGILIKKDDKDVLPVESLSSGEKHELTILYTLLFDTHQGSIVFIDEPEISLHLLWQDKFIHDVQDILNINNFCMIIATHAPAIIGEHMGDKTVQLS